MRREGAVIPMGKGLRGGLRSRRAFSEMDQGLIGLVGLVLTALLLAGALNIGKVLSMVGESARTAEFSDSGGLRSGDDVRIAGIKVGTVTAVDLADEDVIVTFRVGNVDLGERSRALVKSNNALGSKFLAIEPAGSGDTTNIPRSRTDSGYSANAELGNLTHATGQIDARQLARSMESLSEVMAETPQEFRKALAGVSALSTTISSRDQDLAALLSKASRVSRVLARRSGDITAIVAEGSRLFQELAVRRQILRKLLHDVTEATDQLHGLVADNKNTLQPSLTQLDEAARLLKRYEGTLDFALKNLAPYVRSLGESVASGPFFNAYIANLTSPEDLITGGISGMIKQQGSGFR